MATMFYERVVKNGDSIRLPFAGNNSGESWTVKVYQVGTGNDPDTEVTTGISTASAVANTALYQTTLASGSMTPGKMYYAFATRSSDGAVIRFPAWAYDPPSDIGLANDANNVSSLFGKLKRIDDALGATDFLGGSPTSVFAQFTALKNELVSDVATAFTGVAGVSDLATALRKLYDADPWSKDLSGANTADTAGNMLKLTFQSVGSGTEAASATYSSGSVQAKLRKLGEYVSDRLPANGYANNTTSVAAGQAEIYTRLGLVQTKTDLIGGVADAAGAGSVFGKIADVKADTAAIKLKTDFIGGTGDAANVASVFGRLAQIKGDQGAPADGSGAATVFGKVAAVKAETFEITNKVGAHTDAGSATTVFGKLAAIKAVADRISQIANASLLPIVPSTVESPSASVADGIAIKFELKVQDPQTGGTGLEDPATWDDGGTTRYKAHVRVTDLQDRHAGARLFSDKLMVTLLGTSAGGANEPTYSTTPIGGGAATEAYRRLHREGVGEFAGFIKILPNEKGAFGFQFHVVDDDPGAAATYLAHASMEVKAYAATFPMVGGV